MMITIIWGVNRPYIIDDLPEGEHYNSVYFIEHILKPLTGIIDVIWPRRINRKIWLHLDNCQVHNSQLTQNAIKDSEFKRAPHPAYSPDLAPSDFFLFGFIKEQLRGQSFKTEDLYKATYSNMRCISSEKIKEVLYHWKYRCEWVYSNEGEYFH